MALRIGGTTRALPGGLMPVAPSHWLLIMDSLVEEPQLWRTVRRFCSACRAWRCSVSSALWMAAARIFRDTWARARYDRHARSHTPSRWMRRARRARGHLRSGSAAPYPPAAVRSHAVPFAGPWAPGRRLRQQTKAFRRSGTRRACSAPGIDVRGVGGYALLPGSEISGQAYKLLHDSSPAPLPGWLAAMPALQIHMVLDNYATHSHPTV